jgi:hypothetical protein
MLDLLEVFNRDGQLLTYLGGHGNLPGQFKALVGLAIDKQNRVFTTEQYPGRMQMFRYITDTESEVDKKRMEEERKTAADKRRQASQTAPPPSPAPAETPQKPVDTPTPKTPAGDPAAKAQPPAGR